MAINKKDLEPVHLIVSPELYSAVKNNQFKKKLEEIPEYLLEDFIKFKKELNNFLNKLNKHDDSAFSSLSNLMAMLGYNRKYCGMCGKPIIGELHRIQSRLVCETCYESFRITKELYEWDIKKENKMDKHRTKFNEGKENGKPDR